MKRLATMAVLFAFAAVAASGVASAAGRYCTSYDIRSCSRWECCTYRCVSCVDENGVEFYDSCSSGVGTPISCYDRTI